MSSTLQNWSGSVQFKPKEIAFPTSEEEVSTLVRRAASTGQKLRVVGAAHSFTPLAATTDIMVSLDKMQGLIQADPHTLRVTVWAGTRLKALGELLHSQGLAMENLGDIDVQSIAGALSTGTHGTGIDFGTLATQLRGITFVDGSGEIRHITMEADPDIFPALQVSLGSIGIITRLEIQAVPAYKLHYLANKAKLQDVLFRLEDYKTKNRNFEFYWFPFTQAVQTKESNVTTMEPMKRGFGKWFNDIVLENGAFSVLSGISKWIPGTSSGISKISASAISAGKNIDWSHRVYATPRLVRFHEMEYNIPQEHFSAALLEIEACILKNKFKVHFPLECRWVKPDNIYLSPAHERNSAYIAAHMYKGMPYEAYFRALEEILLSYGGRPHWGKMHTLAAPQLKAAYSKWEDFHRIRKQYDPSGVFMSPYLGKLFGE